MDVGGLSNSLDDNDSIDEGTGIDLGEAGLRAEIRQLSERVDSIEARDRAGVWGQWGPWAI